MLSKRTYAPTQRRFLCCRPAILGIFGHFYLPYPPYDRSRIFVSVGQVLPAVEALLSFKTQGPWMECHVGSSCHSPGLRRELSLGQLQHLGE